MGVCAQERKITLVELFVSVGGVECYCNRHFKHSAFKPHILYYSIEEVGELKKVVFVTSSHYVHKRSSEKH